MLMMAACLQETAIQLFWILLPRLQLSTAIGRTYLGTLLASCIIPKKIAGWAVFVRAMSYKYIQ